MLSAVAVLDHTLTAGRCWMCRTPEPRICRLDVKFEQPFAAPPLIHVGIVGLDVSNRDNLRVRVSAGAISAKGFTGRGPDLVQPRDLDVEVSWLALGRSVSSRTEALLHLAE